MKVLKRLLGSRKFLTALATVIITLGVAIKGWDPNNAQQSAEQIINAIIIIYGIFAGATAFEDGAEKLFGSKK